MAPTRKQKQKQKQDAESQREEDDSIPPPSPSSKRSNRSLQLKKPQVERPKPVPSRKQSGRGASSQGEGSTNKASPPSLLEIIRKDPCEFPSTEACTDTPSQRRSSRNHSQSVIPAKRPSARPLIKSKEKNGSAPSSSQSRRGSTRGSTTVNYKEPESGEDQGSSSSEERDDPNDSNYNESEKKPKMEKRGKDGKKRKDDNVFAAITLPQKLEFTEQLRKLQEYKDLFMQRENIQDDLLDDFQDESFELPETSQGLKECPFCHKSLPEAPSKTLRDLLDSWLHKIKTLGIRSSKTAIAECCQRHEAEKVHIPLGKQRKWPVKRTADQLMNRLWKNDDLCDHLIDLVAHPEKSDFYCRQVKRREKYGRKVDSVDSQMQYFHEQQAGYFGELGAEQIRKTIYALFEEEWKPVHTLKEFTNRPGNWMTESDFVDKVLLPEVVCAFIQEDEKGRGNVISKSDAEKIRDESNLYGTIMFPIEKGDKEMNNSFFQAESPKSTFKSTSDAKLATSSPQSRRKLNYKDSMKTNDSREEAIEVSSAQPISSGRSRRQSGSYSQFSSQQAQAPTLSPSRPKPRPSQSNSSQDRIKSWTVSQIASSPEIQPSSSSTVRMNSQLGSSSQIESDGNSPLTDVEQSQNGISSDP